MTPSAVIPKGLSKRQAAFLLHLTLVSSLDRRDYQTLAGCCHATAKRDLAGLLAAGLIVRYGRARASRYSLSPTFPSNTDA